jgi:DNA-directed RNA polymerase subunit L
MTFNPASWSTGEDRNVFVPDESNRVEMESEVVKVEPRQTSLKHLARTTTATTAAFAQSKLRSIANPEDVMLDAAHMFDVLSSTTTIPPPPPHPPGPTAATALPEKERLGVAVYTMVDEDDGVGQLLRAELQRDPLQRVSFAAYRIPHRQEAVMKLRFHVSPNVDPQVVLNDAIERCLKRITAVEIALRSAKPLYTPPQTHLVSL